MRVVATRTEKHRVDIRLAEIYLLKCRILTPIQIQKAAAIRTILILIFLPGYAFEVQESTANARVEDSTSPVPSLSLTLDIDSIKPYADEPIASEECVDEYNKQQETREQFERKLQNI